MLQKTFVKSKSVYKVKFTVQAEGAKTVELLGLNDDWETAIPLAKKKDGSFSTEIAFPKDSKHEFKYRVNQTEWLTEEDADVQVQNSFGSTNSLLKL
ncbi:MAG: isoamylase early set domain-containing protein [Sphingobacteriaceae bacterium]|nr:isoamylase early set domain-containing protein [Sphingobacteriaceae bacterium]